MNISSQPQQKYQIPENLSKYQVFLRSPVHIVTDADRHNRNLLKASALSINTIDDFIALSPDEQVNMIDFIQSVSCDMLDLINNRFAYQPFNYVAFANYVSRLKVYEEIIELEIHERGGVFLAQARYYITQFKQAMNPVVES